MKFAKICAAAALLLAMIGSVHDAAAGTKDKTIFVANFYDVTAYPVGSRGDVAPIALTTDMAGPSGIARDASGRIYVANGGTDTVTVYAASSSGNVPPLAVIGGSNTNLTNPHALVLDAGGKIYVLNSPRNRKASITVYPPLGTSTGILNEAPVAAIAGSKTRLDVPTGIALDSQGNIYVANEGPIISRRLYDYGRITVYPAGSNGNIAPATTISGLKTGLALPVGIAVDSGGNIYVGNAYTSDTSPFSSITVYSAGSKGNAQPIAVIAGDNTGLGYPQAIALDSSGNLYVNGYVEDGGYSAVNVYPAGSNGNVFPAATIAGLDTGLQFTDGIALASGGNIYVTNSGGGPTEGGSVNVYPAGSSGDALPTATITSSFTGLYGPSGIAVDSRGNIYVANQFGNVGSAAAGSIDIYSAGSYATGTPIATIAGDNTGLAYPFGIALDSADNIFVLSRDNAVTVYPAGSAGDAAPNATINLDKSGKSSPIGIAVSPRGDLYVANQGIVNCYRHFCQTGPDSVAVYRAGSDGNAKPSAVISGPDTGLASLSAIAVHSGSIYVTNEGLRETKCRPGFCFSYLPGPGSVTVYPPGSNGNVKPVATISGANTGLGLPYGITLDSSGNIYLLNAGGEAVATGVLGGGCATCASDGRTATRKGVAVGATFSDVATRIVEPILIFAPGINGDVAPIESIGGRFTGLYGPAAIAVGPAGP